MQPHLQTPQTMDMEMNTHTVALTPQQEQAAQAAESWLKQFKAGTAARPYFVLEGFAGTGKSFSLREIISRLELEPAYMAYTGKAALVLRKYSGVDATTIHSQLYKPRIVGEEVFRELIKRRDEADDAEKKLIQAEINELQKPKFVLNEQAFEDVDALVLDECSMVDDTILADLISFRKPIFALGDPGQLPPVRGEGALFSGPADARLTEVLRQAQDSPILSWSMKVRQMQQLPATDPDSWATDAASKVFYSTLDPGTFNKMLLSHDAVICWKHVTRRRLNTHIRKLKGFYQQSITFPVVGDTLIITKNDNELGIFNGMFCEVVEEPKLFEGYLEVMVRKETDAPGDNPTKLTLLNANFEEYHDEKAWEKTQPWNHKGKQRADFGYALTCHKAQGSQWDSVLVIEENVLNWFKPGIQEERARWLYTAVTRAAKKLTMIYGRF